MAINNNFKNFVPWIQMQIFNSTDAIIILTNKEPSIIIKLLYNW